MGFSDPDEAPETVPADVLARAKGAFLQRTSGEVAELVFDSLLDGGDSASKHRLRFEHPRVRVELVVSAGASASSLRGIVDPPVAVSVQVQADATDVSVVTAVQDGAFSFESVGHGVIRLNLLGEPAARVLHTDWFRV
jgi:hypothetical protein